MNSSVASVICLYRSDPRSGSPCTRRFDSDIEDLFTFVRVLAAVAQLQLESEIMSALSAALERERCCSSADTLSMNADRGWRRREQPALKPIAWGYVRARQSRPAVKDCQRHRWIRPCGFVLPQSRLARGARTCLRPQPIPKRRRPHSTRKYRRQ